MYVKANRWPRLMLNGWKTTLGGRLILALKMPINLTTCAMPSDRGIWSRRRCMGGTTSSGRSRINNGIAGKSSGAANSAAAYLQR